ncbi:TetR/AcrR family transcriptional regulator [Catenuloplanes japonicus]|uniref:TetR/AcrR family transcriptional regulator n=1 Tax=Catenuloplanes japonicus TaxID=33876 RepID=UPI0005264BAB|nr:TetR/AcrR family transcriptional regulator [Catenuloplanes japonicus]
MQSARPRADKQRNRDLLIEAAARIVDRDGANASLEQIAREAGVGSATLHRHFAGRQELLSAVFHDRIEALARRAPVLAAEAAPYDALTRWLGEAAAYIAATRGLAAALFPTADGSVPNADSCHTLVVDATNSLLTPAIADGAVDPAVSADDLMALVNGVAAIANDDPATAERLIALATRGIAPTR